MNGLEIIFGITVITMLILDLGIFNKKSHEVTSKEAISWSIVWISLSMAFSGLVYYLQGFEKFTQFQSAYWIEKALSVDNLFVFILVFGYFNVDKKVQHRVLFWGVLGALVFRAMFIFTGVKLINLTYLPEFNLFGENLRINVVLLLFGLFLIYAGLKSWFTEDDDDEKDFSKSPGAKLVYSIFGDNVTKEFEGDKFFVKKGVAHDFSGNVTKMVTYATPLLVVLAVIEFTDLLFAVDSIPAIFAIAPDDSFILYSSNIFAILGLRSLYFLLANFIHMFRFLKYGLAIILSFIGIKMVVSPLFHISSPVSLLIVGGVLIVSTVMSLLIKEKVPTTTN